MKTINDVTLYDLMAEDITIHMRKNEKFGYDLEIEDENHELAIGIVTGKRHLLFSLFPLSW